MSRPLMVELFCGLGGASEGAIAEGYRCVGFDLERHDYGTGGYPGDLVLQDVLTIHGKQLKDAAYIWASPPCQEFSFMAMPWKRGKRIAAALRGEYDESGKVEFPENYTGSRTIAELTALFDACFRIQREASDAAGRYIPLVVENVKGAQPWVGRAQANYGSFYLWGDVRSVGGRIVAAHRVEFGAPAVKAKRQEKNGHLGGGSWFNIAHNTESGVGQNPDGRKVGVGDEYERGRRPHLTNSAEHGRKVPSMNFHEYEKTGKPGRSFQSAAVDGVKGLGGGWCEGNMNPNRNPREFLHAIGDETQHATRSNARKAASAQIAKIPFDLSAHIARCFRPAVTRPAPSAS